MKTELARTAGFCFGVQRAVDQVHSIIRRENALPPEKRRQIYTYGPIVHNEMVVQELEQQGVKVLYSEEELRALPDGEGIVIIRAHGIGEKIYRLLQEKDMECVDASCPFVQKIQRLVHDHRDPQEEIFIVGNPEHPEIVGIVGWADRPVTVLPDAESARRLPPGKGKRAFVVAQTTFNADKFQIIVDILKEMGYYVNVINTICNATFQRQSEAKELAKRSDAMIVIGGSSSSNTKKLYEICIAECPNTQLIQTVEDLNFNSDEAVQNVGITAGASTPKEIIEEVLTYVRNEF